MRRATSFVTIALLALGCEEDPSTIMAAPPVPDAILSAWLIIDKDGARRYGVDEPARQLDLAPGERLFEAPLTEASLDGADVLDLDLEELAGVTQVDCRAECARKIDDSTAGFITARVEDVAEDVYALREASGRFEPADPSERAGFACIQLPRVDGGCRLDLPEPTPFHPSGAPLLEEGALVGGEPATRSYTRLIRVADNRMIVSTRERTVLFVERARAFNDVPAERVLLDEHGIDPELHPLIALDPRPDAEDRLHLVVITDDRTRITLGESAAQRSRGLEVLLGPDGFEERRPLELPDALILGVTWIPERQGFVAIGTTGAVWTATAARGPWVLADLDPQPIIGRAVYPTRVADAPVAITTGGGGLWLGDVFTGGLVAMTAFDGRPIRALAADTDESDHSYWCGLSGGAMTEIRVPGGDLEAWQRIESPELPFGFVDSMCGQSPDECGRRRFDDDFLGLAHLPGTGHLIGMIKGCGEVFSIRTRDHCASTLPWPRPSVMNDNGRWITLLSRDRAVEIPLTPR